MRILSLTTIYPNEQTSAEGRSVAFLDQALAEIGVHGTTLVLKPWVPRWLATRVDKWNHLAVTPRLETRNGTCVVFDRYLHVPPRYRLDQCASSMARRAIDLIKRYSFEFDLVHGQSIYPPAPAARLVARYFGLPYVVTLRDDLSHLDSMYEQRGARGLFEPMFASVSAIFVHGPALERDAPEFLPSGSTTPVVLAANGVDVKGIETILKSLPTAPPRAWGEIVSVSSLMRYKGIHENLRALKRVDELGLRQWRYTIVGDGPYRKQLEALAQELGLADRVVFKGRLPHREAIQAISRADIFCLPSWAEPFGNVYAEAAVCGRPSIGCRGCGAELTIRDGESGRLVPPKDVDALAQALEFLLRHPERTREMGGVARRDIGRFTWQRTARLYRDVMEQILSNSQTRQVEA